MGTNCASPLAGDPYPGNGVQQTEKVGSIIYFRIQVYIDGALSLNNYAFHHKSAMTNPGKTDNIIS